MHPMLENLLRRARLRGGKEGPVQTMRAESLENDAKDQAERWQDYGFAAQPVDGQGLVINAGGHTIVLRVDRLAERPGLAAYEVAVWHKEGHFVKLKAGRVIEMSGDSLVINMANSVTINAPQVTVTAQALGLNASQGISNIGDMAFNGGSITHNGKNIGSSHTHGGVRGGPDSSGGPN